MPTRPDADTTADAPADAATPVACTLTAKGAATQALEWVHLRDHAQSVTALDDGVRMRLPSELAPGIEDLARRERACCAFLTITTSVDGPIVTLDVTSANPDGLPVISAIAGIDVP